MKILRKIIFYLSLLYFCISCNSANIEIDSSLVRVDEVSKKYTYKENGLPVNGRVIFYAKDLSGTQKTKISLREVREGVRIQTGYDYFPNGKIQRSYPYDKTGLISGVVKHYNEQGNLFVEAMFKNNKENGPTRIYNESGKIIKEIHFVDGRKISEYEIDEKGNKKTLATDKTEIVNIESGYFKYIGLDMKIIFQALVKIEFKNISGRPLKENIKIEGIFYSSGKEYCRCSDYLQGASDPFLEDGQKRILILKGNKAYPSNPFATQNNDSCVIFINKNPLKTVKVENQLILIE